MRLLGPELPITQGHRTHLQPSLGSLPSSQRSFARGRAGRGRGRGVPGRALAAGTCSPLIEPRCAVRGARTSPPRKQRRESARYCPPPSALGPAGLKGDAARLAARGVAPALAPPRFPHLPLPPSRSVPQPRDRATAQQSFTAQVRLGLCGAGWVELAITVAAASLRSRTPL